MYQSHNVNLIYFKDVAVLVTVVASNSVILVRRPAFELSGRSSASHERHDGLIADKDDSRGSLKSGIKCDKLS